MDITKTREAMGLNKSELAAKLGVSPSAVTRWEDGSIGVNHRTMIAIEALAKTMKIKVVS